MAHTNTKRQLNQYAYGNAPYMYCLLETGYTCDNSSPPSPVLNERTLGILTPALPDVKVKKFKQAWVNGGINYDTLKLANSNVHE